MVESVAVVGGGVAGAATAHALGEATVFEQAPSVGGRARTHRRDGCTYECGANYLTDADPGVTELVTERLPTDGLVEVSDPVWTFGDDGAVSEGRDDQHRRLTYEAGIAQLPRRLADASGATVHTDTRVDVLARGDDGWLVQDDAGGEWGPFDAVVVTPPAPETADLLGQSAWNRRDRREIREAIESVPYRAVTAAVLHYPFALDRPYYALVSDGDGDHPVGWLAREDRKPGHVPAGESLVLVQMAPDWSAEHYHADDGTVVSAAADAAAALVDDERLRDPDWTDCRRWRYALPDRGVDPDVQAEAAAQDLYFAGDWVAGEARLHAALRSGLDAADDIGAA